MCTEILFAGCCLDADSEDESVKDESLAVHSPQITSVAVDQTVHTFAE